VEGADSSMVLMTTTMTMPFPDVASLRTEGLFRLPGHAEILTSPKEDNSKRRQQQKTPKKDPQKKTQKKEQK
jgi:hypothetical protein